MRRAFVFQLSSNSTEVQFEGRIEHVDSGTSTHFHSIADAVCFVRQVLTETESADDSKADVIGMEIDVDNERDA